MPVSTSLTQLWHLRSIFFEKLIISHKCLKKLLAHSFKKSAQIVDGLGLCPVKLSSLHRISAARDAMKGDADEAVNARIIYTGIY
ncbi:MAG: hypothetical protein HC836_00655 [Richelia sp. RM2_1_2]|nr:hypothetical protein [Richelia sp. SM1_7_0]NJN07596.1 hypothetical protein [Richelia sp. RM1_1_1]NJO56937.1 hypothetical protein [Richelia sp. RM2_1_2]